MLLIFHPNWLITDALNKLRVLGVRYMPPEVRMARIHSHYGKLVSLLLVSLQKLTVVAMRFILLLLIVLLSACASRQGSFGGRIYSYVDAQGHLVQGQLPATQPSSKSKEGNAATLSPRVLSHTDSKGRLVQAVIPVQVDGAEASSNHRFTKRSAVHRPGHAPSESTITEKPEKKGPEETPKKPVESSSKVLGFAGDNGYISAEKAAAQQQAKDHDRFVTYHNAEGRLIRQRIDPVAAKEHTETEKNKKEYQKVVAVAAQQARSRQYIETMTAVPSNCCVNLLKAATPLASGEQQVLHFSEGEYGWIYMRVPHPAHMYSLQNSAEVLVVKTYKKDGKYLHPYVLFLDAEGVPLLAVNNLFQRRYKETWYRYGYLQGRMTVPKKAAFVVFYLPYESSNSKHEMMRVPAPTLVPERGASLGAQGLLVILEQKKENFEAQVSHNQ